MRVLKFLLFCFLILAAALATGYFFASWQRGRASAPTGNVPASHAPQESTNYHRSAFSTATFFDKAFAKVEDVAPLARADAVQGLVVPHHLLAEKMIARAFKTVARADKFTVILLSPNHFSQGRGDFIVPGQDWQTPYGDLMLDRDLLEILSDGNVCVIDDQPFANEHGVNNLTSFIKKAFPKATFLPIIVNDATGDEDLKILANILNDNLKSNDLVIASLDFSHEMTNTVAQFHDQFSKTVLYNLDVTAAGRVDVDSRPTLQAFLEYLQLRGAEDFHFLENKNSSLIMKTPAQPDVTSYLTGYYLPGEKQTSSAITLSAFGDLMLDRYVWQAIQTNELNYAWGAQPRLFYGTDFTLANLEGSFTDFPAKPLGPNNLSFTFNPELLPGLQTAGFNLLSLANNHSLNFGAEGLAQNKQYLQNFALNYFGDPLNQTDLSLVKEVNGKTIAFVAYHQFASGLENVLTEIERLRPQVDCLVLMAHWGNEYQVNFSAKQQELAHQFVDAGADVVLGTHPHVIQPVEIYNNKMIFYSLGNFIFDQTFSQSTQEGLGVGVVFQDKKITYYVIPMEIVDFQARLPNYQKSNIILDNLAKKSLLSEKQKELLQTGVLEIEF